MAAHSLYSFEYELGLMEKQIRMLADLVKTAPVVHPGRDKVGGQKESEFVVVCRQQLSELIEDLDLEVGVMKCGIERLKN